MVFRFRSLLSNRDAAVMLQWRTLHMSCKGRKRTAQSKSHIVWGQPGLSGKNNDNNNNKKPMWRGLQEVKTVLKCWPVFYSSTGIPELHLSYRCVMIVTAAILFTCACVDTSKIVAKGFGLLVRVSDAHFHWSPVSVID